MRCRYCLSETHLEPFKDMEYQFDDQDPIEVLSGLKCLKCGCIMVYDDKVLMFYEFSTDVGDNNTKSAVSGWAMSHNAV